MIKTIEKTVNMVAFSSINETNVVQFRAAITEEGGANIVKNIKNLSLYESNKEECDRDYDKFETKVLEVANV